VDEQAVAVRSDRDGGLLGSAVLGEVVSRMYRALDTSANVGAMVQSAFQFGRVGDTKSSCNASINQK
jgi:hypothetical protein